MNHSDRLVSVTEGFILTNFKDLTYTCWDKYRSPLMVPLIISRMSFERIQFTNVPLVET